MYRWYESAVVCYATLADYIVFLSPELPGITEPKKSRNHAFELLRKVRWFQRGWTLQELLAPKTLMFFDARWDFISWKNDMLTELTAITGIHVDALQGKGTMGYSIAQRMSWASNRRTSRLEDEAYCLLGLFGINMPLIYGEGSKAFRRLQEELLLKASDDQSILAWELLPGVDGPEHFHSLLAPAPANFWWHAGNIQAMPRSSQEHQRRFRISPKSHGLEIITSLESFRHANAVNVDIACLECYVMSNSASSFPTAIAAIGLRVRPTIAHTQPADSTSTEVRHTQIEAELVSTIEEPRATYRRLALLISEPEGFKSYVSCTLFISTNEAFGCDRSHRAMRCGSRTTKLRCELDAISGEATHRWRTIAAHPRNQWFASSQTMTLPGRPEGAFAALTLEDRTGLRCTLILYCKSDEDLQYWLLPGSPVFLFEDHITQPNHEPHWRTWLGAEVKRALQSPVRKFGQFQPDNCFEDMVLVMQLQRLCDAMALIFEQQVDLSTNWSKRHWKSMELPRGKELRLHLSSHKVLHDFDRVCEEEIGAIQKTTMHLTIEAMHDADITSLGDPRASQWFSTNTARGDLSYSARENVHENLNALLHAFDQPWIRIFSGSRYHLDRAKEHRETHNAV